MNHRIIFFKLLEIWKEKKDNNNATKQKLISGLIKTSL